MLKKFVLAGAAALSMVATAADATKYMFTLTGTNSASFTLDDSPTPSTVVPNQYFTVNDVAGSFANAAGDKLSKADVSFYLASYDGGIGFASSGNAFLFSDLGAQLFTGTLAKPTFKTGTFTFTQGFSPFAGTVAVADKLVIAAVGGAPGAVPEPATWALFIGGMGFVGSAMRRRNTGAALA